jgi:hypothetical protein
MDRVDIEGREQDAIVTQYQGKPESFAAKSVYEIWDFSAAPSLHEAILLHLWIPRP